MKKIVLLIIAIVTLSLANATPLHDRLLKIKGVSSVEQLDKGTFEERYVVMIEQPLDHKNIKKGTFEQRFVVAHSGFDRPTLMITEGYGGARALNPKYREEISAKLNTNQVYVEHRYFGESTPSPRNWDYMTGENAVGDLHAIRTALKEIYPQKWVASGISKGGQNTMIYATLYPNDVDIYVPYVGPICFGIEDGRHEPFLEQVGTELDRTTILEFQKEVLSRRKAILPLFNEYCKSKEYKFTISMDEVLDYTVLEYPFSIWQWGTAISTIPTSEATNQELTDHLIAIVSPDYFGVTDEPSFYVQAARELGYYGYDIEPFKGLLSINSAKGYLKTIMLPADAKKVKFSPALSNKITEYLTQNDPRMIFIYGEIDPWSAAMPLSKVFEGKKNMELVMQKGGSHKARINNMPDEIRDAIWQKLGTWLKSE